MWILPISIWALVPEVGFALGAVDLEHLYRPNHWYLFHLLDLNLWVSHRVTQQEHLRYLLLHPNLYHQFILIILLFS